MALEETIVAVTLDGIFSSWMVTWQGLGAILYSVEYPRITAAGRHGNNLGHWPGSSRRESNK